MVRLQFVLMLCIASLAGSLAGCSTFGGRDKQWEPDVEAADKWGDVGKEGRGNRKVEKNRDPIDKLLWSDQAAQINRNLGVE